MHRAGLAILLLTLAAPAWAQDTEADRFREVEAGFEDVGPGAVSTLVWPVDMRAPTNFERVYEVVGSGGLYARRAGAVTAVFDRSLYAGAGTPLIPAGTIFYLGSLPVDLQRPGLLAPGLEHGAVGGGPAGAVMRLPAVESTRPLAQRVDLRVKSQPAATSTPLPEAGGSIWTSERYRQRRVGELLRGAAWRLREIEAAAEAGAEGRRD